MVLSVILGKYTSLVPFLLVERLSTDVILGCDYIERQVEPILSKKSLLVVKDNKKAPFHSIARRSWAPRDPVRYEKEPKRDPLKPCSRIYATRRIFVPPQSETVITVLS